MKAKVCLIGPVGVGKSLIASKIDCSSVSSQLHAGTKFANCDVLVDDTYVHLQISDISGEEKLRCMSPIYYKEAKAAMCVFDLTSEKTLQALRPWIKSVKNYASEECLLILIGNKSDLEGREISPLQARNYAESVGGKYFEVSAFTGKGLLNLMIYIAKRLMYWKNCYKTYAAKRSIASNFIEHKMSQETKVLNRRFSFPLRKLSLIDIEVQTKSS